MVRVMASRTAAAPWPAGGGPFLISKRGGALADHDLGGDKGFSFAVDPRSRHAQGTAGAEAGGQLAPQCASALNVKGLVNRLVTDTHRIIIGKVERQAPGNLFRAPRYRPLPVLPAARSACFPRHLRSHDLYPVRRGNRTCKPVLHITAQGFVPHQLGCFGTAQRTISMPLRGGGAIFQSAATRRGVPAQLAGDRRRGPPKLAGNRADSLSLNTQDGDLFALGKR